LLVLPDGEGVDEFEGLVGDGEDGEDEAEGEDDVYKF